jgi:hypothetical protein
MGDKALLKIETNPINGTYEKIIMKLSHPFPSA